MYFGGFPLFSALLLTGKPLIKKKKKRQVKSIPNLLLNKKIYIFFFKRFHYSFFSFLFQNLLLTIYQVFIFLLALILYHVLEIGKISWKDCVSWIAGEYLDILYLRYCVKMVCVNFVFSLLFFSHFLKKKSSL